MQSDTHVFTLRSKSLLSRSRIPSLDYAVNPYFGCEHGCLYCYATFMLKFREAPGPWGSFVGIKENAPDVLAREVARRKPGSVMFGSVCDAYQPVEARYALTRACLQAFIGARGFEVGVLTKSDLVVRDLDVLKSLESPRVGFTVTTLDDRLAGIFEPGAPPPRNRLLAMRELARAGIPVWGFLGPVLPTFSDSEETLRAILGAMRDAGAGHALVDMLNLYPRVRGSVIPMIARSFPDRLAAYQAFRSDPESYAAGLAERVRDAARAVGIDAGICF
jgi:DNA repair photolyase